MFDQSPEQRILRWREFRESLDDLPEEERQQKTLELWSHAPLSNQFYSPDLVQDWPDPWQLITEGLFDDIGHTLGIYYTLVLESRSRDYIIRIVKDNQGDKAIVFHTPSKTVLNWGWCDSVNIALIESQHTVVFEYTWDDLNIK